MLLAVCEILVDKYFLTENRKSDIQWWSLHQF